MVIDSGGGSCGLGTEVGKGVAVHARVGAVCRRRNRLRGAE